MLIFVSETERAVIPEIAPAVNVADVATSVVIVPVPVVVILFEPISIFPNPDVIEPESITFNELIPVTARVPPTVVLPVIDVLPEALMVVAATEDGEAAPSVVASIAPPLISTFGIVVVVSVDSVIFAVPVLFGYVIVSSSIVLAITYPCSPFL
jgi:hypothetical protein